MHWYYYVAYFFGGAFLSNCMPHLISGVSGRAFQSSLREAAGQRAVFLDRERSLGILQSRRGLCARDSRGQLQPLRPSAGCTR